MKFDSIEQIKKEGFVGFRSITDLYECSNYVPEERGVYMAIYLGSNPPEFMVKGTGGFFKKDPNYGIDYLNKRWVNGSVVLNIGQAGGIRNGKWSNATLRKRITDYVKFGNGHDKIGHSGGRLIWQLKNNSKFLICWKTLPNKIADPRQVEIDFIKEFESIYGKRPFANINA